MIQKLTKWYFSKKLLPYWCIFLFDCTCVFLSMLLAYLLNGGLSAGVRPFGHVCVSLLFYMIFFVIGFRLCHTYSGVFRFSSFVDLLRLGIAMVIGLAMSLCAKYLIGDHSFLAPIRARDLCMGTLLGTLLMWGTRVVVKQLYDSLYHDASATRIFIFGIKEGGISISIAKSIRNQDSAKYTLAGFITDQPGQSGRMLMGVNVFPFDDNTAEVMKSAKAKALFVSPLRSHTLRDNPQIVDKLIQAGIKIFMVPAEQEWDGKSDLSHSMLHEVAIEDLLPRDKIEVDMEAIGRQLRSKRILITGAAGSIGSEMVRQIATFRPAELVLIDQAETPLHDIRLMMARDFPDIPAYTLVADITNRCRMEEIFRLHKPQYVMHAAAYKHVPMMEDNPNESIHNNVDGTRIIADLAVEVGTLKFVMISTDKAVNPTNVMGASKRICEIYVQSLDKAIKEGKIRGVTQFVTTRFGNVLGSNGSVIPLFREQIKNGGPITVTHPDIIRFFMLIPEACRLVLEAGTMGHGGEIFVFDMGQPVKIVDLAKRMIELSGAQIEIKFTGLRDGEKLYEEVLNDEETTLPTFHKKIKIAKVREYDYDTVKVSIDDMVKASLHSTNMEIVALMKKMVPEFRSQHSIYQQLDK